MRALLPDDVNNRALLSHAHPTGWPVPTPPDRYNLLILGGGTAGLVAAAGAAGLGAKVALVERHLLGGDCLNVGCVPSKALLRSARVAAEVRGASAFGIRGTEGMTVDFPAVMERMRRLRAEIAPNDSASRFRDLGVHLFFGEGRFSGPDRLEVDGLSLRFSRALIATGGRPAVPAIPGLADTGFLTNEQVFSLTALPARLGVIGGGPVGCELAQAFRRFGSEVHLFSQDQRLLPREEEDASALLHRRFSEEGIQMRLGVVLQRIEKTATGKRIFWNGGEVEVDEILLAAGRRPNVEGLGLDRAGVVFEEKGVRVNPYLQTSNPAIYASGDVCSPYPFTHAADAMSRIVLRNALFWGKREVKELVIPRVTYTDPEIAQVGASTGPVTLTVPLSENDRAILDGQTEGFARVHLQENGTILGATFVGSHAGESMGELVLAMRKGIRLGDFSETIHPYPTQADALRRLGDLFQRRRLTPSAAKLLNWILRVRR